MFLSFGSESITSFFKWKFYCSNIYWWADFISIEDPQIISLQGPGQLLKMTSPIFQFFLGEDKKLKDKNMILWNKVNKLLHKAKQSWKQSKLNTHKYLKLIINKKTNLPVWWELKKEKAWGKIAEHRHRHIDYFPALAYSFLVSLSIRMPEPQYFDYCNCQIYARTEQYESCNTVLNLYCLSIQLTFRIIFSTSQKMLTGLLMLRFFIAFANELG